MIVHKFGGSSLADAQGFKNVAEIIKNYGDKKFYCFDDLGVEPTGRHFGKDCNVMGEILLSRYDLFLSHKTKTHATTNLNAKELEERYGNRVRSRMRQLFNLIAFDKMIDTVISETKSKLRRQ